MAKADILVVEDEGIVAHSMVKILERLGYDVPAVADTGEEALRKAELCRPDLVLMDIQLKGGLNGAAAAEMIRSLFGIPVVYLTAYSKDTIVELTQGKGPLDCIFKPFDVDAIESTIARVLRDRRAGGG